MFSLRLAILVALLSVAREGAFAAPATSERGALVDAIDFSDPKSEAAHAFSATGEAPREPSGDSIGNHALKRVARVAKNAGSALAWSFAVTPNQPLTLEFEEIENRGAVNRGAVNRGAVNRGSATENRDETRAVSVFVEGKRARFYTAPASGAGPLHFFVEVAPQNRSQIRVRVQNESAAPFRLARAWVFADFARYFETNGLAVPFYLAPTMRISSDFQGDLQKLGAISRSLGANSRAKGAWTTWLGYANLSDRGIEAQLDAILARCIALDLPVQLCLDTWWGNTPSGNDGQGGFWSDVAYQQVVYNATQGKFQLSVPNRWGNTPWLSPGNARLNAFKAARLQSALRILQKKRLELRARGQNHLILAINLDNEPVYWATGNAGLGTDILQADFGSEVVERARQDGIALDPRDGLSVEERLWLRAHLLGYNQLIADAAQNGAREATVVDGAMLDNPGETLRDNIYTQAMVANPALQFPMQSAAYPFWETAAPRGVRVGSEWNGNSRREREAVLHTLVLGRTAQVNAETGGREDEVLGVRPGYGLGMRFYALYNYPLDKMEVAAREIAANAPALETPLYERILREETFEGDWQKSAFETKGLQRGIIGNTLATALYPDEATRRGHLTYRIEAPRGGFEGVHLEMSGRAFVSKAKSAEVFIRVLAGDSPDPAKMNEVGRVFDNGDVSAVHRFDVSGAARGQKALFTRLELQAGDLPPTVLSWCAIYQLRWTRSYPLALTQIEAKQNAAKPDPTRRQTLDAPRQFQAAETRAVDAAAKSDAPGLALALKPQETPVSPEMRAESLETQRQQSLLVSWRRDAEISLERLENALAKVPDFATLAVRQTIQSELARARLAYRRGEYAAAYRLANQTENTLPGATYHVVSSGALLPYPLHISTPTPLDFTLESWNRTAIRFAIHGAMPNGAMPNGATVIRLRIGGLSARRDYVVLANPRSVTSGAKSDAAGAQAVANPGSAWEIRLAKAGDDAAMQRLRADDQGVIAWSPPVPTIVANSEPQTLSGTVRSIDGAGTILTLWREDAQGSERIELAPQASVSRRDSAPQGEARAFPVSLETLQRGDAVAVQLDAQGRATKVVARTQTLSGSIAEIGQLTPFSMPIVRLRGEITPRTIDLSAPLALRSSEGQPVETNFKAMPLGSVPLRVGDQVRLRLQPDTGRVFALSLLGK